MAGADQSRNLGGMLSQIGTTLGAPMDVNPLMRSIENSTRPGGLDPNNLEDMQKLQQWQQRIGREGAARTTGMGIQDLQRRQEEERNNNIQKATVAAQTRYANAIASGDEQAAAREKAIIDQMGAQFGIDSNKIVNDVRRAKRSEDLQTLQLGAAADRQQKTQQAEQISQVTSAVIDRFGVDSEQFKKLKEAPLLQNNREAVQSIETRELNLMNARNKRAEQLANQNTAPDLSFVEDLLSSERLSDQPELKSSLETLQEKVKGKESGKWLPAEKAQLQKEINFLERQAANALNRSEITEDAVDKGFKSAINKARSNKVTQQEIEAYQDANDTFFTAEPSREEAIEGIIREREEAIRNAYGRGEQGVFTTEAEADAAFQEGKIQEGDVITINGRKATYEAE